MSNTAAWLVRPKARPLAPGPAPFPTPGPNELVVRNAFVAVNPVDWKIQTHGTFHAAAAYPTLLGTDVAGSVHAVGAGVAAFRVGDPVIAHCLQHRLTPDPKYAGFQLFTVVRAEFACVVPERVELARASVLPLSVDTAAAAMYMKAFLGLDLPVVGKKGGGSGKALLVWGGASSVGSSGVQFGRASGYAVLATASAGNMGYVKDLGATEVFDYRDGDVEGKIVNYLKEKGLELVGVFDTISESGTPLKCFDILEKLGGGRYVGVLAPPPAESVPSGIQISHVFAARLAQEPDIAKAIWQDYLPAALAAEEFLPKPDPIIIEGGLEKAQEALDTLKRGVSAAKIVLKL